MKEIRNIDYHNIKNMKTISTSLLIFLMSIYLNTAFAETVTVNLTREGSLAEKVLEQVSSLSTVTSLTVTGVMNEADWNCVRAQMTSATYIDMSGAKASFTSISACNTKVTYIAFPSGIKTVGYGAFRGCSVTDVVFNDGLEAIGDDAFSNTPIKSIKLPAGLKSIGREVFEQCNSLQSITIPSTVQSIGDMCFWRSAGLSTVVFETGSNPITLGSSLFSSCSSLKNITLPGNLTIMPSNMCSSCASLQSINLPTSLTSIGSSAFSGCTSLASVTFPKGLTSIADNTFSGCTKLANITFPEELLTIGGSAFAGCTSFTELSFPQSIITIGSGAFNNCTKLIKVTCLIPFPISLNNGIFSGFDKNNCTLYVPEWSALLYRMSIGWSEFAKIETVKTDNLKSITISDSRYLPASVRPSGTPNVAITPTGAFTARGTTPFSMDTLTLNMKVGTNGYGYDNNTGNRIYYSAYQQAVMLNDSSSLSANTVRFGLNSIGGTWSYVTFPFDVALSDVKPMVATDTVKCIWKKYDGERRALVGTGGNWKVVSDTLRAGVGYIYQCQNKDSIYLKATNTSKDKIFNYRDVIVPLNKYTSSNTENESWNFIGNPYATYFDTHFINFTAPITVWNGTGYTAVSLTDDSYVLRPYEAFFLQKPSDVSSLTFFNVGRKAEGNNSSTSPMNIKSSSINIGTNRSIINLYLENSDYKDKCRIVFNKNASLAYEQQCDAAKFISTQNNIPQLYSLDDAGTSYAINERPQNNGIVKLGVSISKNDSYTFSLDSNCPLDELYLYDKQTKILTNLKSSSYTFAASSATIDNRFIIETTSGITALSNVNTESIPFVSTAQNSLTLNNAIGMNVKVISINGVVVREWFNQSNSTTIELPTGFYIIEAGNKVIKAIVR